jgi:DNA replication protein DnaC
MPRMSKKRRLEWSFFLRQVKIGNTTCDRITYNDPAMRNWTFEHDNGRNPQTETARFYVDSWETMQAENIGYLFWGGVGTGKSYLAACIANALMEKEVAVCMTNFATILNDLAASFEGRNEYISRLCSYPLLILDDFGMERGTEYGLEQVYSVIDSRYRSGKPLIATTNLTLEELQHPQDTPHARIYDRLTSMCAPVRFTGSNFRKETAQEKLERLKQLMKQRKAACCFSRAARWQSQSVGWRSRPKQVFPSAK